MPWSTRSSVQELCLSRASGRAERGAFFKSLHGTLNHLLVGDRIWMQRFTGSGELPQSLDAILYDDFEALRAARIAEDARISRYIAALGDVPGLSFMPEAPYGTTNAWLTCMVVDPGAFGADREAVRLALEAEDIEARPLWKPMHLQPIFASHRTFGGEVGARLFEHGLCLPSGSSLTDDDQDRVVATLLGTRRSPT